MDTIARLATPMGVAPATLLAELELRDSLMTNFVGYDYSTDDTALFHRRRQQVELVGNECVAEHGDAHDMHSHSDIMI